MIIVYRISDGSYKKNKEEYILDKKKVFEHFLKIIKESDKLIVIADNVLDTTYQYLISKTENVIRTNYKSGGGSFLFGCQYVIDNYDDDNTIYFVEDDYVHMKDALTLLEEGIKISDYCTVYDHPDKYDNPSIVYGFGNESQINPYVKDGGEITKVYLTKSSHWKKTHYTTMTFAVKVSTIKKDLEIYKKHCKSGHPYDFELFTDLITNHNRVLINSIPSHASHGESAFLAPLINWKQIFNNFE